MGLGLGRFWRMMGVLMGVMGMGGGIMNGLDLIVLDS